MIPFIHNGIRSEIFASISAVSLLFIFLIVKINIKAVNNLIKLHCEFNKKIIFVQKNIEIRLMKVYNFYII